MALTKDRTLVWISDTTRAGRRTITWIGYPLARKKDLETRLKTMASKKVRGQRLEALSYDLLDEESAPFTREYLNGLFRISDLSCAQVSIFEKGSLAEQAGLEFLAVSLKEQYPDSEFEIVFDSRHLRKSALSRWMKKNQIHGTASESLLQENRMLQSATLLSMIDCARTDDWQLGSLCARQFDMAKNWKRLDGASLYLERVAPEEREAAAQLFERVPALLESGRMDSWLKKELPAGVMVQAAALFDHGMPEESLLELHPRKISESYELLCHQLEQAQRPLDESLLDTWLDDVVRTIGDLLAQIRLDQDAEIFRHRTRRRLDAWIENPAMFRHGEKPTVYLLAHPSDPALSLVVGTYFRSWLDRDLDAPSRKFLLEAYTVRSETCAALLASLHPAVVLCDSPLMTALHGQSVLENRYLPLAELDSDEKNRIAELIEDTDILPELPSVLDDESSRGWFSEMIADYLEPGQIDFLASHPFSLLQTGQLARAFARGLSLEHARHKIEERGISSKTVYHLVAPYLFSTKQKRFLDGLEEDWEFDLIAKDSLSLSQMAAIDALIDKGLDPDWISVNLKGKTTVRQIQALAGSYPYGRIPKTWQKLMAMPAPLSDWLVSQALSAHPQIREQEIVLSLRAFCQSLMADLFCRDFDWMMEEA